MTAEHLFTLRKFVVPEFIFGVGSRKLAGRYARNFGARKVLIVTDPGVIANGWTADVQESLNQEQIPSVVYSQVTQNPKDAEVMAGAEVYKREGCDVIVAVGGGSPIDCAKGIGVVSSNKRDILTFEGVDKIGTPMPPLICIPTTGGTSADVSQFAIICDQKNRVKIAIISKAVVPDVALIDPFTLTTMSPYLSACTGIDALVHAVEAFVSNGSSSITDLHALEAIRLIHQNLAASIKDPQNIEFREKIMRGSLEAGIAFSNASLGAVHAMAHSLGGFLDLPHGECNAILLRHVMEFNYDAAEEKYAQIGEALGLSLHSLVLNEKKRLILEAIDRLKRETGVVATLGDKGIRTGDIPILAQNAAKDPCFVTNPRKANKRDIEVIYGEAI